MERDILMLLFIVAGISLISIVGVIFLSFKYFKLNKKYYTFMNGISEEINIEENVLNIITEMNYIEDKLNDNREKLNKLNQLIKNVFIKYDVIRYDAYDDTSGKQSFSICILDNSNNGYVLSGLYNPRNNSSTYAKEIKEGKPQNNLSKEEKQVLYNAINKS